MGNIPLCIPKSDGLMFSKYAESASGQFSMQSCRPYHMSLEDLRPFPFKSGKYRRKWSEGSRDSGATILGIEMDLNSVWLRESYVCSLCC